MPALYPHNAEAVLRQIARRVSRALARLDPSWRCLRVLPRVDGTAAVELREGDRALSLHWVAPWQREDGDEPRPWGALVGASAPAAVRRAASRAIEDALAQPGFALLGFVNQELPALQFGDGVVDTLLAGRLAPGQTRWFGWTLAGIRQPSADRFTLTFTGAAGPLAITVSAPEASVGDAELILGTAHYRLWLAADPRPPEARGLVPEQVERFVGFLMARAVRPGLPVLGAASQGPEGRPGPASEPFGEGAPVSTSRWGNPRQWHQFFSDFEIARAGLCGIVFTEPFSSITHGEPECHRVEPSVLPRHQVFARIPFSRRRLELEHGTRGFSSVMDERAAVFGGNDRLERALDAARAHPAARLVLVNNTCLPKMVGDDVASLVAAARRPEGPPIFVMNTDLDSPEATYQDLVRQVARAGDGTATAERIGLALLGFPPGPGRDELAEACRAIGLPVAGILGPELSRARAEAFRRGALQVVYPAPPWPALRTELFGDPPTPWVSPPAPFGLQGCDAWFAAVAEAAGVAGADLDAGWAERRALLRTRHEALLEPCRGVGMAFVVDGRDVERILSPERCYGVRLLALYAECGLALRIFLRVPEGGLGEGEAAAIEARLGGAVSAEQRPEVAWFASPEELDDLLSGGDLRLVYSEVERDDRPARHGLLGVGLDLWELGPGGALRSLARLGQLARWGFAARYHRHLPPRPELRLRPEGEPR